jgi:L-threonylcarbamoyladenylate synthase
MDMQIPLTNQQLEDTVAILRNGGVVAYPTDTLYGLGASTLSNKGLDKLFEIKGRPPIMALPVFLSDHEELEQVAEEVPELARILAAHFWPGALTLVLLKKDWIPDRITGNQPTVGVRIPDHPLPRALVAKLGAPITATSANLSGRPAAQNVQEVNLQLGPGLDLIIDGGPSPVGYPSTVLDCSRPKPFIIREGAISRTDIELVSGVALGN